MKKEQLDYLKISRTEKADNAILVFHGFTESKYYFEEMATELAEKFPNTAFYLANAPEVHPEKGYCWFQIEHEDMAAFSPDADKEVAMDRLNKLILKAPVESVHELTDEIVKNENISYDKVIYAGFSQGGIMALASGVTSHNKLGGVVAMSAIPLIFGKHFGVDKVKSVPDFLLTHSTDDMVVPYISMGISKQCLQAVGANVEEYTVNDAGHTVDKKVQAKLVEFLTSKVIERG